MEQENKECITEEDGENSEEEEEEEEEMIPDFTNEFSKDMLSQMLTYDIRPSPRVAKEIINKAISIFSELPNIVEINNIKNITIVGDTHGQFHDVAEIFKTQGFPTDENPYIFNGDFVDRGKQGVEIILALFAFKISNPNSIHLNRGNHEIEALNKSYGFMEECTEKYGYEIFYLIEKAFRSLPIAHVVNHSIFVVHGGLCRNQALTIPDLQKIDRFNDPDSKSPVYDLLWNDPMNGFGFRASNRCDNKQAMFFGCDVTEEFLNANKLKLIVRSHQVQSSGYSTMQDGKCVTIFSAPNYMGDVGNKGAIIKYSFNDDGQIKSSSVIQFDSVQQW